uniref:Reverse transcriptase domain-containing protein n=1 Tax=Fagus sylvatica TaxID=28930 RepID=A0A2N9GNJ6_FAGSY
MGEWVEDRDQLMALIQKGYSDLFTTSHTSSCRLSVPPCAPSLSDLEAQNLDNPLSSEEIKSSLWSLKPFKAPGPDGLHPGFFQRCWHIVSDSVVKEVSHIFNWGQMPSYLNKTLISLIPKCVGPESLSQFRPISLCNTVYKIVTKSIVARIRPLLSNLISPFQAAFVPGRRGIDNVIIAQELIHSLHKKKGAKGSFVVKIDLEKAYDRLEWSFIREVHFPNVAPDVVARLSGIWGSLVSGFRTLTAKYCPNGITSSPLPINRGGSSNWRGLKLGHEVFRNGLRWVVNNGQHVSFWHDTWVGNQPLEK